MAGSTSSGKLPAEAAASAGWPAASRPLSPLLSVSWVDGGDEIGTEEDIKPMFNSFCCTRLINAAYHSNGRHELSRIITKKQYNFLC